MLKKMSDKEFDKLVQAYAEDNDLNPKNIMVINKVKRFLEEIKKDVPDRNIGVTYSKDLHKFVFEIPVEDDEPVEVTEGIEIIHDARDPEHSKYDLKQVGEAKVFIKKENND